jgi:hypothetical protein
MVNPNPTYYKRQKVPNGRTVFMFESLKDYYQFIDDVEKVATGNARRGLDRINVSFATDKISTKGASWFGTTSLNSVINNIDSFLFNNKLDSFLTSFRNQTINLDVIDIDQQKAIKFTEKEIGIFSFDLASLGLIRVYEYFSPLLNGIVSPNLVISNKNNDGKLVFYHIYQPEIQQHEVRYNLKYGGYYSEVLNRVVQKSDLIEVVNDNQMYLAYPYKPEIPQHVVEQRQKLDEKGRKMFSSTFKRSFIEIPKIEKQLPRVDLIINSSPYWTLNAENEIVYASLAAITIAEKLSKANVNFRIYANYSYETFVSEDKIIPLVLIKKEGEPFDKNKIAILLSDARQLRYKQFKGAYALQYDAGYDREINPSVAYVSFNDAAVIKQSYIDFLKLQDNPEDKKAAENPNSKIVFSGAYSEQEAINQYNDIISQISKI